MKRCIMGYMKFPPIWLVCYTAVFSVVTQCSSGGALRDDTENGCVADYSLDQFAPEDYAGTLTVQQHNR